MATMDALMVEEIGKPIMLRKRPIPSPAEGEILVKVTVVGCEQSLSSWKILASGSDQ